jgi:hypothetical protein
MMHTPADKPPLDTPGPPRLSAYQMLAEPYKTFRRFSRRSELMWRYTCNLKNVVTHRVHTPFQNDVTRRIVRDLDKRGIAITTVSELFGSDASFRKLAAAADELEHAKAQEIAAGRAVGNVHGQKAFVLELLGAGTPQPGTVFCDFAQQREARAVADGYFRMKTKLRACNVWRTFVADRPARQSQLWHRDPEDRYILKMFVLLSDVDEGAGPFNYAAGTHMKGDRNHPFIVRHGLQDSEMTSLVPQAQWVTATGPRGTVVFADTRGYHKGGLALERERLVFVSMYLSY